MKLKIGMLLLATLTVSNAMAVTMVSEGVYIGNTAGIQNCGLTIESVKGSSDTKSISFFFPGIAFDATGNVTVEAAGMTVPGTSLKVENKEFSDSRIKISLANDGTPVSAKMGESLFSSFGYAVNCKDLVRVK